LVTANGRKRVFFGTSKRSLESIASVNEGLNYVIYNLAMNKIAKKFKTFFKIKRETFIDDYIDCQQFLGGLSSESR